ncbi:MAG: roadblock/LC7 domain-containing protein [Mariprofundaceae bacterium]|nr:roadblock/LC7 domain-containing protein [Mariprofundaceae bacterium]
MAHAETSFAISNSAKKKAEQALKTLVKDFDCVVAAILASPDGLLMASCTIDDEVECDAVAAMSSSIISLGDALTAQATHDENHVSKTVLSETETISIATMYAGTLILTTIGHAHANMGTVLSRSRQTAAEIAIIVDQDDGKVSKGKQKASFQFDPDVLLARVLKNKNEDK